MRTVRAVATVVTELSAVAPDGTTAVSIPWISGLATGSGTTVRLLTSFGLLTVDAA